MIDSLVGRLGIMKGDGVCSSIVKLETFQSIQFFSISHQPIDLFPQSQAKIARNLTPEFQLVNVNHAYRNTSEPTTWQTPASAAERWRLRLRNLCELLRVLRGIVRVVAVSTRIGHLGDVSSLSQERVIQDNLPRTQES